MPDEKIANITKIGVPILSVIGAIVFAWGISAKYNVEMSEMKFLTKDIQQIHNNLEKEINVLETRVWKLEFLTGNDDKDIENQKP